MPTYEITAPDGNKFRVSGEGTQEEALAHFQQQYQPQNVGPPVPMSVSNPAEYDASSPQYQAKYGPTAGSSTLDNLRAGAGKAFVDLGRGAGQMVGLESRQDVAQSRAQDAPLMATTAGKVGNVVGNVAATVPAMAIPGANTVAGAGLLGAGFGFMQPSTSTGETLINTGLGAGAGALGQWGGNKVASAVGSKLAGREAAAAQEASLNSERDAVLAASQKAGYKVPPTAVNPSATNTALESVSGKAATRQAADAINAKVSNKLIREDLGLAANQPLTQGAYKAIRDKAGTVYGVVRRTGPVAADQQYLDDIAKLANTGSDIEGAFPGIGAQASAKVKELVTSLSQPNFDAGQAVSAFRFLNERAKAGFKAAFGQGGNVEALDLARAQKSAADAMGELIERHLSSSTNPYAVSFGNGALAKSWQEARVLIAKSYTAEAATKGGNVSALRLAQQLRKGAPLTGGFKTVAQFGDHFADVAKLPKSGVGVSKLEALIGGGAGATAAELAMRGHPIAAAGVLALGAAPYATRKGILSRAGQNLLATPNYAPGMLGTGGLNALGKLGKYGTLPAYLAGSQLVESAQ